MFFYPATAPVGEEPIDLASIFEREGDKTNPDLQIVTYEGMDIVGHFDCTTGEVKGITCVKEHETGKALIPADFVLNDGRRLEFGSIGWSEEIPKYYAHIYEDYVHIYEDNDKYEITCLYGKNIDKYSGFYERYMIQEGDEIICLLQISNNYSGEVWWQTNSGGDILFKWNVKTGESSILYETSNKNTRIIGYKDGKIYLLHNYWVSVQSVDTGKREKLFKIPKRKEVYCFDWQGDYLIVTDIYGEAEVLKAYKIE